MANELIERLRPCPFCGGERLAINETEFTDESHKLRPAFNVTCTTFGCHGAIYMLGYGYHKTEEDARKSWNRRASPTPGGVVKPTEDAVERAVEAALRAKIIGEVTIDDYISCDAPSAAELGVTFTSKDSAGRPRWHGFSDIRGDELADTVRAILTPVIRAALEAASSPAIDVASELRARAESAESALSARTIERDLARSWATEWHRIADTICTCLGLGALDSDQMVEAVRSRFERQSREVERLREALKECTDRLESASGALVLFHDMNGSQDINETATAADIEAVRRARQALEAPHE